MTAVLGSSTYSSLWIKSPYEQILRVDHIKQIPGSELDLLHLVNPAIFSRGVSPLGVPLFQPPIGTNHTCYATGYSDDGRNNQVQTALLRSDPKRCEESDTLCFTVSQKPVSCSVRMIILYQILRLAYKNIKRK